MNGTYIETYNPAFETLQEMCIRSKAHTASTHAYGFPSYVRVWLRYLIMQEVIQNHENVNALNIGQGEDRHRTGLNLVAANLVTVQVTKLPL